MKTLVMEPDATDRARLLSRLRGRGHAVTAVAGAEAALEAVEARRPSLLILDWTDTEGGRLCRRIRETAWGWRCVIVARGLQDRTSDLHAALQGGADDYFAKTAEAGRVEACLAMAEKRVGEVEDRARAEDELRRLQRAGGTIQLRVDESWADAAGTAS